MAPPFLDVRVITSGVETFHHGGDPLAFNPFDQFQRSLNYPRAWLYAFVLLNIRDQRAWLMGLFFCALYLLCISKLIAEAGTVLEQLTLLVAALSIAPLFAIERGNIDLPVFAMVFLGTALAKPWQRAGMFWLATVLKLFPIAALAAEAIRQREGKRLGAIATLAAACVALAAQANDLRLIARGTPVAQYASYGVLSIKETLWCFLLRHTLVVRSASFIALAALLSVLIGGALFAFWAWRRPPSIEGPLLQSPAADRFFLFGAIYVSTFAIGSNWDYRLIFLIPTLPFAFALLRTEAHFRLGFSYIVSVLLVENCVAFDGGYKTLVAEAVSVAVFLLQLTILAQIAKMHVLGERRFATSANASFVKLQRTVGIEI